jgi:hypothetical protein
MKKLQIILSMCLLTSCAQDMGHYVALPSKSPCKTVIIAPNRHHVDDAIYKQLVEWAQHELPTLDYIVLDTVTPDSPPVCGEVLLHYSSQLIPMPVVSDTPKSSDPKMCVNTPGMAPLFRYQLILEIQDPHTQEKFFSISTEMESTETDIQKILLDMEQALYAKFLRVQGPESHVEVRTTSKILPASKRFL